MRLIKLLLRRVGRYMPKSYLLLLSPKRKRKRSDSVLWQMPLHQQNYQKGKMTTQNNATKSSITQRLRTDLGRSVWVTTATKLVWLTWFTGSTFPLPAKSPSACPSPVLCLFIPKTLPAWPSWIHIQCRIMKRDFYLDVYTILNRI